METPLTLRPGQNGTGKLAERFGKRLVRVRYRYDEILRRRYTMGSPGVGVKMKRPAADTERLARCVD